MPFDCIAGNPQRRFEMDLVAYVHGKGGSPEESRHYEPQFEGRKVIGISYAGDTPWQAGKEIHDAIAGLREEYDQITLIAVSAGAYFCLHANLDNLIRRAYFISPLTDMERMILTMMKNAEISEDELKTKEKITLPYGEVLSWEYFCWVRSHPVIWNVPTEILYGRNDQMIPYDTVREFALKYHAGITLMPDGEHWFHTPEQMDFIDAWITEKEKNGYDSLSQL